MLMWPAVCAPHHPGLLYSIHVSIDSTMVAPLEWPTKTTCTASDSYQLNGLRPVRLSMLGRATCTLPKSVGTGRGEPGSDRQLSRSFTE